MMTAIRELKLVDVPTPTLEHPKDVLVKVRSVGICGSDLHGYLGHSGRRIPPLIMGHEVTGDVIAVGTGVERLKVGDRVAIQTVQFCGECPQCIAGNQNLCQNRLIMGMNAPGAYAEMVRWRESSLSKIPDKLSYEDGAMAEPLAIAVHAVGRVIIRPYDTVYIVGAGPIGLLALSVLKHTAAQRIIISDMSDTRLEIARSIGAHITVNPSRDDPVEVVKEHTGGRGADIAFEAAGNTPAAQQTLAVTRSKGDVIWIGNNHRMVEIDMQAIVTRELTVRGAYGMSSEEFERTLSYLADGLIPTDVLINRRAVLQEGPELFEELLETPETIKCIINFD
jgi:L-iditol 2-dehydrogenase